MANYPTSHINASPQDFAPTVLMPGDPLRAKFIAENYLENAKLINNIRGIQGYTGTYKGKRISVMASGMGMPSMGIYSYELFNVFNVNNIIRIGTAGAFDLNVKVRDIVIGMGASTDSNYALNFNLPGTYAPLCSYNLLEATVKTAREKNLKFHVGNILSTDVFYNADDEANVKWAKMGVIAVEMEAAALYMNAAKAKKNALAILTVSNHIITGEEVPAKERETTLNEMMELRLETALNRD